MSPTLRPSPAFRSAVTMQSGKYTGFVPDLQRRTLMNIMMAVSTLVTAAPIILGFFKYITPPQEGDPILGSTAGDKNGDPILVSNWLKTHKPEERDLVQGLSGAATWLITTSDGLKDFGINAICTHLGCVVPWVPARNRFCCPCHGSQYDENGMVVRGPAPLSLPLVHVNVANDNVLIKNWTETDFRMDAKPWWIK